MCTYPRKYLQKDLKKRMQDNNANRFTMAWMEAFYIQIMEDKPEYSTMAAGTFRKLVRIWVDVEGSWISSYKDETGREFYYLTVRKCLVDEDCQFSELYIKAKKLLDWREYHNWYK